MQQVLVVSPAAESEPAAPLTAALREAGFAVVCSSPESRVTEAPGIAHAFGGRPPDILVADLTKAVDCLPLRHLHRILRQVWGDDLPPPPCLVLFDTRLVGLPDWPAYADDFLLPPYSPREALARIALLQFRRRHVRFGNTLAFADIIIDLSSSVACDAEGHALSLTPREYDLLAFLVTHRGRFFARDRLLDLVWGIDYEGGERTVDIHIRRLRAKLPPGTAALLETRRGLGYGFRTLASSGGGQSD